MPGVSLLFLHGGTIEVHFSSSRDDWETPPELFAALDAEFNFTLDACALPHNAKCTTYYTPEDDGLAQPWTGTVWANVPYGRQINRWAEKAIRSADAGATVVLLVPARTDAVWFQQLALRSDEVRFVSGRVRFVGAENPAPFPSAVVVLRPPVLWSRTGAVTYSMPRRHAGSSWVVMRCGG